MKFSVVDECLVIEAETTEEDDNLQAVWKDTQTKDMACIIHSMSPSVLKIPLVRKGKQR